MRPSQQYRHYTAHPALLGIRTDAATSIPGSRFKRFRWHCTGNRYQRCWSPALLPLSVKELHTQKLEWTNATVGGGAAVKELQTLKLVWTNATVGGGAAVKELQTLKTSMDQCYVRYGGHPHYDHRV